MPNHARSEGPPQAVIGAHLLGKYKLFGDLILEEVPLARQGQVQHLEPYLRELEHRGRNEVNLDEMSRAHDNFRDKETRLWKDGLPSRQPEHIVRPSGSWFARVAHHLHNPSYTTLYPEDGEVGDWTNGCTALILGNNYDPDTHFLFDHFHRREEFDPFSVYPTCIKALHEAHTEKIRETVQAKIEILYGSPVRKWAVRHLDITSLQLWGTYDGVWVHFT